MKNKRKVFFIFLISFFLIINIVKADNLHQCIEINKSSTINIGDIVRGTTKHYHQKSMYIKFEIISCEDKAIKISKSNIVEIPGLIIETEWRAGSTTGFEEELVDNGVYSLFDKKFYVTVSIKSITVLPHINNGQILFTPSITVELINQ